MTETEVIEKLEFFKNAIINLKNELNEKDEMIDELTTPQSSIIEENLQNRIEELEKENFELKELNKIKNEEEYQKIKKELKKVKTEKDELAKKNAEFIKKIKKTEEKYVDLKNKAYHSIKHLVEDEIEPKEKEMAEIQKRIAELESILFEKNKEEHKMIVKSAEKEIQEMLAETGAKQ